MSYVLFWAFLSYEHVLSLTWELKSNSGRLVRPHLWRLGNFRFSFKEGTEISPRNARAHCLQAARRFLALRSLISCFDLDLHFAPVMISFRIWFQGFNLSYLSSECGLLQCGTHWVQFWKQRSISLDCLGLSLCIGALDEVEEVRISVLEIRVARMLQDSFKYDFEFFSST